MLYGQPVCIRHRAYPIRKVAWRIQARGKCDLSEPARQCAAELADYADVHVMASKTTIEPPSKGGSVGVKREVRNGEHNDQTR